ARSVPGSRPPPRPVAGRPAVLPGGGLRPVLDPRPQTRRRGRSRTPGVIGIRRPSERHPARRRNRRQPLHRRHAGRGRAAGGGGLGRGPRVLSPQRLVGRQPRLPVGRAQPRRRGCRRARHPQIVAGRLDPDRGAAGLRRAAAPPDARRRAGGGGGGYRRGARRPPGRETGCRGQPVLLRGAVRPGRDRPGRPRARRAALRRRGVGTALRLPPRVAAVGDGERRGRRGGQHPQGPRQPDPGRDPAGPGGSDRPGAGGDHRRDGQHHQPVRDDPGLDRRLPAPDGAVRARLARPRDRARRGRPDAAAGVAGRGRAGGGPAGDRRLRPHQIGGRRPRVGNDRVPGRTRPAGAVPGPTGDERPGRRHLPGFRRRHDRKYRAPGRGVRRVGGRAPPTGRAGSHAALLRRGADGGDPGPLAARRLLRPQPGGAAAGCGGRGLGRAGDPVSARDPDSGAGGRRLRRSRRLPGTGRRARDVRVRRRGPDPWHASNLGL
ncbi:MAG: Arginine decarboxylase, partial [uncultured Thermomicrobiales bacterium]